MFGRRSHVRERLMKRRGLCKTWAEFRFLDFKLLGGSKTGTVPAFSEHKKFPEVHKIQKSFCGKQNYS